MLGTGLLAAIARAVKARAITIPRTESPVSSCKSPIYERICAITSRSAGPTFSSITTFFLLASSANMSVLPDALIFSLPPSIMIKPDSSCSMLSRNAACRSRSRLSCASCASFVSKISEAAFEALAITAPAWACFSAFLLRMVSHAFFAELSLQVAHPSTPRKRTQLNFRVAHFRLPAAGRPQARVRV
jgi:hypothetical protein